jgi:hypothetical protein
MMFFFGSVWGWVNLLVFWGYFRTGSAFGSARQTIFSIFIVAPIAVVLILGPFFSPWVALPLAQKAAWNHGCDNYPIQVVLDARAYDGPSYQPTIASYFQGNTPLYAYDIFQASADEWSFNIRTIYSQDLANNRSSSLYPSISNITYNFVDNSVSGNCTSPSSNTTSTCIEGYFNPNNYLSFNLTDLRSSSTAYIRAVDKQWAFDDDAPSVLLKDSSGAQDNGPSITVPMGLILIRQMDYAIYCTTPQDDGD